MNQVVDTGCAASWPDPPSGPETPVKPGDRARILCVDDEPWVLEGLRRQLHRRFRVSTAVGGAAGLEVLEREGPFAVVVSDMRMPVMNGAAFLRSVWKRSPNTVRVLLTGYADFDAAVAAVNQGNIFRLLTKPCRPEILIATIEASAAQSQLVNAERSLLEQAVEGSRKALTEVMDAKIRALSEDLGGRRRPGRVRKRRARS